MFRNYGRHSRLCSFILMPNSNINIIVEENVPFVRGLLDPYATVRYLAPADKQHFHVEPSCPALHDGAYVTHAHYADSVGAKRAVDDCSTRTPPCATSRPPTSPPRPWKQPTYADSVGAKRAVDGLHQCAEHILGHCCGVAARRVDHRYAAPMAIVGMCSMFSEP